MGFEPTSAKAHWISSPAPLPCLVTYPPKKKYKKNSYVFGCFYNLDKIRLSALILSPTFNTDNILTRLSKPFTASTKLSHFL